MIRDKEGKTWQGAGTALEDFYCYNKPVLSPADAVVEEVINYVEDNPVGGNNTRQNWGNTIVLKHAEGLHTKLSHLRKGSIKVARGEFVKKGMLLAACGNSGRSPEPHLHFQVQATPYIGSRTLAYPFASYIQHDKTDLRLPENFTTPKEEAVVSNLQLSPSLLQAFDFKPGLRIRAKSTDDREEEWEVMVSAYNETYFYAAASGAYAYFVNDGSLFYFTNFYGGRNSLLYLFYLAAYKVILTADKRIPVTDTYPQGLFGNTINRWLQDFIAPFYIYTNWTYACILKDHDVLSGGDVLLESSGQRQHGRSKTPFMNASVMIKGGGLTGFSTTLNHQQTTVQCEQY